MNEISKEDVGILKKFEKAFSEGKNMNGFLSNNIKKSREADFLQYTWHIFHLHVSDKFVENQKQMKNNRSDTQLLCIIDMKEVYFIDVIPHPQKSEEYFDAETLEIIINNGWAKKIGFNEIENINPKITEYTITNSKNISKDIFDLYSKGGVNIVFECQGKGYIPVKPMGCNRRPYRVFKELKKIHKEIEKLKNIKDSYLGFRFDCNAEGVLLGLISFKTKTGEVKSYNIF